MTFIDSWPRNVFICVTGKMVNFVCIGMERKNIMYKFCVSHSMNKNFSDTTVYLRTSLLADSVVPCVLKMEYILVEARRCRLI